ncbi:MAG: hypothetical protein FJ304_00005 [Planctomycetes bacterium]|nr:hypothetical protein [Planctomycetota bacterium]
MNTIARSVALLLIALTGAPAVAQPQQDRRSRDEPEIVVEARGRVGPCDVLRFSPDGNFLFAAGDDKVVRVWPHSAAGLDTEKMRTLRWRAWREQRGGIKAIAISDDGARVLVGGYGMKRSSVAVLDRASGDTLALSWPVPHKGELASLEVTAVALGADGRAAFGTSDGALWLWTPTKLKEPDADGRVSAPPVRVGKFEPLAQGNGTLGFNFPRLVFFRDKDTLVGVAHSGQVVACDLTGKVADAPNKPPPVTELFHLSDKKADVTGVYRAELIDGGAWIACATSGPEVILRSTDGAKTVRLPLGRDRFPRSIAWHPKTRELAVGVGTARDPGKGPRFFSEGDEELWFYPDPTKPGAVPKPSVIGYRGRAEALAYHPTLPQLAVAGGTADQIYLQSRPDGKTLTNTFGAGRRLSAVNISANGKLIGVRVLNNENATHPNARGAGPWTKFDLTRAKGTQDEPVAWANPLDTADGWTVTPTVDRFVWNAKHARDGVTLRLATDRLRDLAPTCFTFLPAKGGAPTRLIVGHYYGCTLFELDATRAINGALAGAKVFTGHAGEVTSVVASADQSWFVTGGSDHTLAAWSLADWKHERGLGATFDEKDGAPVVVAVDTGSPAWEAGLRPGDALDLLAVGGRALYERRAGQDKRGTAAEALAALKAPRARVELYFGLAATATAGRRETLTTVRQRPAWKWFPAFDKTNTMTDWVAWMWHGSYYHTKTANGDRLCGWHVNAPDPGDRPRFYQLQQFEKQYHKPELIEKLLQTRDVRAALVDARGANPVLEPFSKYEPAPVRVALDSGEVPAAGVIATITVRPRGTNPDLLPERVEVWLNDHLLDVWPRAGTRLDPKTPFEVPLTIPADKFRAGENALSVIALNAAGGRAEETALVRNPRAPADATLLALLAGVNDYSDTRKGAPGARKFGDLTSAKADATSLRDQLDTFRGPKRSFAAADLAVRLDAEVARKSLTDGLDALAKRAKPDDLLVVFFAGHGDFLMPKDGPLPGEGRAALAAEGVFLFCCPNYSPANPGATALAVEELFAALARVNCRKLVLIDACHSGRAAVPSVLRRCAPNGQGPVIFAACAEGELSYEDATLGHGLFTRAVLDALDKARDYRKADYNSDGALSAEELFDYVSARVPVLLRQSGRAAETQTPVSFPRQLPKAPLLRK